MGGGSEMIRCTINVRIELLSETIISSGHSIPGGEDISLRLNASGRPFLPGSTLKGLLRESMRDLMVWKKEENEDLLEKLFGKEGHSTEDERRLVFGMLQLKEADNPTMLRAFTKLTPERVAEKGSLRVASCLRRGLCLEGKVTCGEEDYQLTSEALQAIKWIGLHRNRGFGRVKITTEKEATGEQSPVSSARYLHYRLRSETPLTLGEQHGGTRLDERKNYLETRKYIPGSAIRGYVMTQLALQKPDWFEEHKKELLGNGVKFLNAFPCIGEEPSIPTPYGFYEDKAQTRFYSVLKQDVVPGDKRAKLGAFCRFDQADDTKLICGSPKMSGALRILRTGDKQIFNANTIAEGTLFDGYIVLEDPEMADVISSQLLNTVTIGADRFAGSGFCTVTKLEGQDDPYWAELRAEPDRTLYMMLLSPTALCKDGEIIGMDGAALAGLLGVSSVQIHRCSTSVTEVQGFNRKLGIQMPAMPMYAAGSVFCLQCSEAPSAERMRRLEQEGLGLRRNEGFGQVLFLRNYEKISKYEKFEAPKGEAEKRNASLRRARVTWLLANANQLPVGPKELSESQIGSIQALCEQSLYNGAGKALLTEYFSLKAITPKQERAFEKMKSLMESVLDHPLDQTLGCPVPNDSPEARMELLIDLLNLSRKGGNKE